MMSEVSVQKAGRKKDSALTQGAFRRLLEWLDDGSNSEGGGYLEMRRRLVSYFNRKGCATPDELADETLNRVARRLEEEGSIESESPAKYCYTVARYVFMEHLRDAQKTGALLDRLGRQRPADDFAAREAADREVREKMLSCLERCTGKLDPTSREIITRYYMGKERVKIENRRALAEELGITPNALSVRACRIRDRLEDCVRRCADEG